jgi:hypothetical protein
MKADPLTGAIALSAFAALAAPGTLPDNFSLFFWLITGSLCGVCFVLFGDEKKAPTWFGALSKISQCFVPGLCFTGIGIKWSGVEISPELVLGASFLLSVCGPFVVTKARKWLDKKTEPPL